MAKILVILPTLGERLDYLRTTLESVDAQRSDVELTLALVSPVSATAARDLGASFGAVCVDDPAKGISAAINAGLAVRTDETLYAWIGDDDLFRPGGLRILHDLIEAKPGRVVAYGGCDYITPDGETIATSRAGKAAQWLLPWGPDLIPHPGSVIQLDALEAIGGFDTSLKYAMDLDAFLKLRRLGTFASTKTSVSAFRWHPDSLTVSNRSASSAESEAIKRAHLPRAVRPLSVLWVAPVRWASSVAARTVSSQARKVSVE